MQLTVSKLRIVEVWKIQKYGLSSVKMSENVLACFICEQCVRDKARQVGAEGSTNID